METQAWKRVELHLLDYGSMGPKSFQTCDSLPWSKYMHGMHVQYAT